jgi:hypothetical protein
VVVGLVVSAVSEGAGSVRFYFLQATEQDKKETDEPCVTVALGQRDFKLFTNCANGSLFNLAMTRDASDLTLRGIQPYGVRATLAIKETTSCAQVPLQVGAFHASGSSMISRTASDEMFFTARSPWHSNTIFSASKRFVLASASVSPCEIAAGISCTKQVCPPSLAGSKTAVSFMRKDYHTPILLQRRRGREGAAQACLPQAVVSGSHDAPDGVDHPTRNKVSPADSCVKCFPHSRGAGEIRL